MIKRPKCGESEEDLLKFQEEFFRSQQQPSVVVKKVKQTHNWEEDPEQSTKVDRDVVTIEDETEEKPTPRPPLQFPNEKLNRFTIHDSDLNPRQLLDVKDKEHVEEILTNIQEKSIQQFSFSSSSYKTGFPKVPVLNKDLIQDAKVPNTGKKKSLFAQQYSSFNEKRDFGKEIKGFDGLMQPAPCTREPGINMNQETNGTSVSIVDRVPEGRDIVGAVGIDQQRPCGSKTECFSRTPLCNKDGNQASNLREEVHQENVERLKKMTEEEILEEQKKLLKTLDPKLVEFFRTRKKVQADGDKSVPIKKENNEAVTCMDSAVKPNETDDYKNDSDKCTVAVDEENVEYRNGNGNKESVDKTDDGDNGDLNAENLREEVHQENVERLKTMTEEEILEEQKKLLKTLDPKLVEFFRTRKKVQADGDKSVPIKKENNEAVRCMDSAVKANETDGYKNDSDKCTVAVDEENVECRNGKENKESADKTDDGDNGDLNAELGIRKDYINMNVLEKEKLEWMKDVPKVELKEGSNVVPRFDFEGLLIDPDDEISVTTGLHHHGDDQGAPGYTLEELFHLSRSNFPQQRVFSLQMLAKIFDMYHQQKFVGKLTADLLSKCLDAGLVFILRWSLDEQDEQIYSAAVSAIANVVYVKSDQDLIENYLFTENRHRIPSLCTYFKKKDDNDDNKDGKTDQTDAQLVSLDLIKGLLQIQIIPRLRYIIDICNPSESAINNCIRILIRMVQHNAEVAHAVFKYKLLVPSVFKLLSSANSSCKQETKVLALQLVRSLCQASKSISQEMVEKFMLHELICSEFSSKQPSTLYSSGKIYIQICHIWAILLRYGISADLVRDLYSVIMNQLQQFSSSYKNLGDKMMASLINVIDSSIDCTRNASLKWSLIEGLFPVVHHTLRVLQKDMFEDRKVTHPYFISALLRFCGTYYQTKNTQLSDVNPVTLLDEVENFWKDIVDPIFSSPLIHKLLDELRLYSDFKSFKNLPESSSKNAENLPSYGTYCLCGYPPPSFERNSPMVIVQGLLKLVLQLVTINKVLVGKVITIVVAPETLAYIKFLLECGNLKRFSMLASTRIEMLLLSHLLQLFYLVGTSHGFLKFGQTALNAIHEMAYHLISYMHFDDFVLVERLMSNIVFNPKIFRKQDYVLWVSEYCEKNLDVLVQEQLQNARKDLTFLGGMYKGILLPADMGKAVAEPSSLLMATLQTKAVPSDWMFFPIVHFFNASVNIEESGGVITKASPSAIATLKQCLEFVLLVELTRPALVANIPETIRFTRVLCLFMTEGLMFNEKPIKDLVLSLLAVYSSPTFESYLNFEMAVPGMTSFYDFYKNVVQMYISTSFSDPGFANMVLFPLQLQHLVKYRLLIWTECSEILRLFPLPLNEILCDLKEFLAAENEDIVMVRLYFQALVSGTVNSTWCPLFYLIAVHHVNHFVFSLPEDTPPGESSESLSKERSSMLNKILTMGNKEVRDDVVLYKCFDINRDRGVGKFSQLPPSRDLLIRRIKESK